MGEVLGPTPWMNSWVWNGKRFVPFHTGMNSGKKMASESDDLNWASCIEELHQRVTGVAHIDPGCIQAGRGSLAEAFLQSLEPS